MAVTLGIDTSSYQDPTPTSDPSDDIAWDRVERTAYDFALARMSIGRTTRDVTGRRDLAGMLAEHIPVPGAYGVVGYAEPVTDGAKLLVDEIAAAGADPRQILVMLDAEDFGDHRHPTIDQVDRYAQRLHELIGRWPVAYVPGWWLDGHGYTVAGRALANCPWAASRYFPQPWTETRLQAHKPGDLHGFKNLAWLQYASSGTVGGVATRVDLNCYYGTPTELRAQLLGQQEEIDLTKQEFIEAWTELTAQGVIQGQDNWADYFRVAPDRLAKILAQEQANGAALTKLGTLLEAGLNVTVTLDLATASPQQVQDLGNAIADRLTVNGPAYAGTIEFAPKTPPA